MQHVSRKRMRIVSSADPFEFENAFNKTMDELLGMNPVYELKELNGNLWAIITYEESEKIVETVADEFHLEGIRYVCSQCPLHEEIEDKRLRKVPCKYHEYGEADLKGECCELFYKKLKQGTVSPIIKEPPTEKKIRYIGRQGL